MEVLNRRLNVRVYGLCLDPVNGLLVADERIQGRSITKLPGGGLEFGEGTLDCLKREFMEETGQAVNIMRHFYTTDFFVRSFFELSPDSQIISIYYLVESKDWAQIKTSSNKFDFEYIHGKESESFRWVNIVELENETDIVLPIDKVVVEKLVERFA